MSEKKGPAVADVHFKIHINDKYYTLHSFFEKDDFSKAGMPLWPCTGLGPWPWPWDCGWHRIGGLSS